MNRDQQRLADYLAHITEAIKRIDRYTGDMDEATFLNNQLVQDAVIRNFEIIGEASNNIEKHYPDFAASHPELPLSFAYQMRNALAHGYFKVDLEIVWKTIQGSLPDLHAQYSKIAAESVMDNGVDAELPSIKEFLEQRKNEESATVSGAVIADRSGDVACPPPATPPKPR